MISLLEKDRGFQNLKGTVKSYGRVGVKVQILLPSTKPYLWWGYLLHRSELTSRVSTEELDSKQLLQR